MKRILFVCLGNICRSPMAEALFVHKARQLGLEDQIEADSAGIGHWHVGSLPHSGTRRILSDHHIPCSHRARQIEHSDLDKFDYVVAMDDDNYEDIHRLGNGRATIARLMDYAPGAGVREVPDPYYTGGFEDVYRIVDLGTDGLIQAVRDDLGMTY